MTKLPLEQLDISSQAECAAYERAFYMAFQRAAGNRLIRSLWTFNDAEGRLATRIPYEHQIVYVLRNDEGRIVTGIGINVAMRMLQAAAFGFRIPSNADGCCEFLTLFSVGEYRIETKYRFQHDVFRALHELGFHTGYSTTAHRVLRVYLRIGAQLLDEKEIEGEMRYFLKFDLRKMDS